MTVVVIDAPRPSFSTPHFFALVDKERYYVQDPDGNVSYYTSCEGRFYDGIQEVGLLCRKYGADVVSWLRQHYSGDRVEYFWWPDGFMMWFEAEEDAVAFHTKFGD